MTFLAPIFWLVSALAVPVVLFYLVRERPRRQRVSTLLFWEVDPASLSENARWRKLRRWLSLLLQLLFLFLLIAALTRPLWPWATVGAKPVVVVLDGSASLRATDVRPSRFQAAVDKAGQIFSGAGVSLLLTGEPPRVLSGWTDSRHQYLQALATAASGVANVDPTETLRLAKRLAVTRDAEVVFLTDGVWEGQPTSEDLAMLDGVQVVRVGSEARNAGVSRLAIRRSPAVPGEVSLLAEVRRSATDGKSFAEFSLEQNGVLLDSRDLDLADGKPWTREWTFQEEGAVRYRARVEGWEGDVLGYDNSFEVAIPALPKLEAVLVSEPDRYLEAALASIPAFEFVRVWPPDSLKYGDANKLWIFQGALPPKDFQAAGLVLIAPGESGFFGEYAGPMSEPWITEMDSESELLRMVAMDRVSVGEAFEYLPKEGATAYVSSAGRPLLFGRWNEPSRWVVFGFRPSKSDLVTKAAFPLLMSNLVQSLRGDLAALAMAEGASPALTELVPRVESGEPLNNAFGSSLLPARPLWWWLVFAAMVWLFLEWWTYHRRITE